MQNRTFRLFVSSTFYDFTQERSLLQTVVFPEIKKYCSSNKLTFQPIDLRWAVSSEAQLDQKTLELCLNEVKLSKLNPYPNFLIMAGDRYSWIPYLIEEKEFDTILDNTKNSDDKKILNSWYNLDKNQIPSSYILNERKNEYVKYKSWEELAINLLKVLYFKGGKVNYKYDYVNKNTNVNVESTKVEMEVKITILSVILIFVSLF